MAIEASWVALHRQKSEGHKPLFGLAFEFSRITADDASKRIGGAKSRGENRMQILNIMTALRMPESEMIG